MKRTQTLPGVAAALILSCATACGESQQGQPNKNTATFAGAERVTYKEVVSGASSGPVWGDPDKGAHSTFTKFAPGFDAGMHSHTNDLSIVGLKGAYLYRDEAGEKRVGSGEFLRIPGGHKHWSGGDAKEGALFYQHSTGKFDLVPAK
jgi:quercetin dioxygenase-like cupin family protein